MSLSSIAHLGWSQLAFSLQISESMNTRRHRFKGQAMIEFLILAGGFVTAAIVFWKFTDGRGPAIKTIAHQRTEELVSRLHQPIP